MLGCPGTVCVVFALLMVVSGCASVRGPSALIGPATGRRAAAGAGDQQQEPQIDPDRPDVTNAAYTVPKGLAQLESGAQRARVTTAGQTVATPTSLRAGIAHWGELRIETGGVTRDVQGGTASTGFAGLAAGAKVRLWQPASGALAVAVMPEIALPWGRTGGGTDYTLRFLTGGDVIDRVHLDVNYEVGALASGHAHFVHHLVSASTEVEVGEHWQPYVEIYWVSKSDPLGPSSTTIDAGATYTLSQRFALDAGAAFGLDASPTGPTVFAGLSVILGELASHREGVPARLREAQRRGDR